MYNAGVHYYHGTGGYPLDYDKAFQHISVAAKAGHDEAMHYLGVLYLNGEGTEQNYQLAIDWFYKALQTNSKNGFAAFELGRVYLFGLGTKKDYNLAFDFFDCAIKLALGNTQLYYPTACYFAGSILLRNEKYEDAFSYFVDAAEYGNYSEAWYNLGLLLEKGFPKSEFKSKSDYKEREGKAFSFYKKAAELGDVNAMYDVGRICITFFQFKESCEWLEKAAAHGHEEAKKRLKGVRSYMRHRGIT